MPWRQRRKAKPPGRRPHENVHHRQGPTLISEEAIATGKAKYGKRDKYPNDNKENAHAELSIIQNFYDAGLLKKGDSLTIPVTGKAVCRNCTRHLAIMAEKTELGFMTVIDKQANKVYYWHKGMKELSLLK